MSEESLYMRLGGYDAIEAVVDDFTQASINDPQLEKYFTNISNDSCNRVKQLTVDFIVSAIGGPVTYLGRDMKTAHAGMGISEEDWNRACELIINSLDKFKCPEREKEELCACIVSLKDNIVE